VTSSRVCRRIKASPAVIAVGKDQVDRWFKMIEDGSQGRSRRARG
jgi:hypothetical protein